MPRNVWIGLLLAAGVIIALFLLLDPGGSVTSLDRDSATDGTSGSGIGPDGLDESGAGTEEGTEEPSVAEVPDPTTPPLLRGTVIGEGQGIPGAQVMLFSASRVEALIRTAEERVTSLAGGGMPDIAGIVEFIRSELESFRRSAVIATSDVAGDFEVRGVPEGGYFLLTIAPRWLFRYGDVVSLAEGRTEELTLELDRGAAIAGRVVRRDGSGMEGVRVIAEFAPASTTGVGPLVRKALRYVNGEFLKGPFETTSGPDGSFEIASLPPGTYDITAYDDDGVESTVESVLTGTSGVYVLYGDAAGIVGTLATPQGFPLGNVTLQLDRVDTEVKLPIPGVEDYVATVERMLGAGPREAVTEESGAFAFRRIGAGRYRLNVETPGLQPYRTDVEVDWGEVLDLGEIPVDPGSRISGRVLTEAGRPLPGATVSAMGGGRNFAMGGDFFRDMMSGRLRAVAGADGSFELFGLRAGQTYALTAAADGHAAETKREIAVDGPPVDFALAPGRDVSGVVLDATDDTPIAKAVVRAGASRTTTDANGRFTLSGVVPPSFQGGNFGGGPVNVNVNAEGPGGGDQEVRVTGRAPGFVRASVVTDLAFTEDVVIALEPIAPIEGIVLGPDGAPRPGALVRLTVPAVDDIPFAIDTSLLFFALAVADADGRFRMEDYFVDPNGQYRIIADYPGFTRGSTETFSVEEIPVLGPVQVSLRLASTVRGTVSDGSAPVPGAVVRLTKPLDQGDMQQRMFMQMLGLPKGGETTTTDADGAFEFESHEPGTFVIGAEMVGFTDSPTQEFTLIEGGTAEFQLVIDPGSSIGGTITDDLGTPIPDAIVRVLVENNESDQEMFQAQMFFGGAFKSTRTGADGRYEVIGLPSGGYTIVAEKRGFAQASAEGVWVSGAAVQDLALVPSSALRGRVVDAATGAPVSEFEVSVVGRGSRFDWGGDFAYRNENDPDGWFVRDDLSPGEYEIAVRAVGYATSEIVVDLAPGVLIDEEIVIARAGRLAGTVYDAVDGVPVEGARVAIARDDDGSDPRTDEEALREVIRESMLRDGARTGSDGTFLLENVPPGPQVLVVNHPDYVQLRVVPAEVRSGEEAEVVLQIRPGSTISGVASTPDGLAAASRFLLLRGLDDENAAVRKNTVTDDAGAFRFAGLEPGRYRILAPGGGSAGEGSEFELGETPLEGIELVVPVD